MKADTRPAPEDVAAAIRRAGQLAEGPARQAGNRADVQGISISTVAGWLGLRSEVPVSASVAEDVPIGDINNELIEVRVTDDLHIAGKQLREITPSQGLIMSVMRGKRVLVPTPRTRIRTGAW